MAESELVTRCMPRLLQPLGNPAYVRSTEPVGGYSRAYSHQCCSMSKLKTGRLFTLIIADNCQMSNAEAEAAGIEVAV